MGKRLSLRARLLLAVVALAAVGLVVANVATYSSLSSFLLDRTDSTLDETAHTLRRPGPGGGIRLGAAGDVRAGALARRGHGGRDLLGRDAPRRERARADAARHGDAAGGAAHDREAVRYFTVAGRDGGA